MSELFSTIIGHQPIKEVFRLQLANNTLAHAYCFVGPKGVGKRTFVRELVEAITRTPLENAPDVFFIRRVYSEKKERLEYSIGVDQMREVNQLIRNSSFSKNTKCIVIEEAQTMTEEAQSAFLKMLEEPPSDTVMILLADSLSGMLPTILSRSNVMRFTRVPRETICEALKARQVSKDLAHALAGFADGCPGIALNALARKEEWRDEVARAVTFFSKPLHDQFALIDQVVKQKSREETEVFIRLLRVVAHDLLLQKGDLGHLRAIDLDAFESATKNNPSSLSTLVTALGILGESQTAVRGNIAPALALEQFALAL